MSGRSCAVCRCALSFRDIHPEVCDRCLRDKIREEGRAYLWADEGEEGSGRHSYAFLCPRCGGSGQVVMGTNVADTFCFSCGGNGMIIREREIVQQTARWWATYQQNRVRARGEGS